MKYVKSRFNGLALALTLTFAVSGQAALLVNTNATWNWWKGTNEASTPIAAWRSNLFNDAGWIQAAPTPFWYGDVQPGGTQLTDMQNTYSCIFLRRTFTLTNVAEISALRLSAACDDGFIAYINGAEVYRFNMPVGDPVIGTFFAVNALGDVQPFSDYDLTSPAPTNYLVVGNNTLAIQVFNATLGSSDLGFDVQLNSILVDPVPPTLTSFSPDAGTLNALTQVSVVFSEPVIGVNAADLLVNGQPATGVAGTNESFVFTFNQPAYGTVTISFAAGHGITDLAFPGNPFDHTAGNATWQYSLVDNTPPIVAATTPIANSTVATLTQIDVLFNEPVSGVEAADLIINGEAATNVIAGSASQYSFRFTEPTNRIVQITWAGGHGIRDNSPAQNAFVADTWTYVLDPNAAGPSVFITEFMADNDNGLSDENNQKEDWIEIYNAGASAVNLLNWSLTDDMGNPTKWQFPATNLNPGVFLIVFASENDVRVPGRPLHTNFKLEKSGEYLALAMPDGTIVSEFTPLPPHQFPSQFSDVSYGYGVETATFTMLSNNAPARVRVPTDNTFSNAWVAADFDDAAWLAGTNGVGYDTGISDPGENTYSGVVLPTAPVGYWRFSETNGTVAANLGTGGAAMNGTYNGTPAMGQAGPRPPDFNGFEGDNATATFNGANQFVGGPVGLLSGRGSFTLSGWIKPAATPGNRIGLYGQNDVVEFGFISGWNMELWTPNGGSFQVAYPFQLDSSWHHVVAIGDGTQLRIYMDGTQRGSGGGATANYGTSGFGFNIGGGGIQDAAGNFFNGQIDEVIFYDRALNATEVMQLYIAGTNAPNVLLTDLIATDVRAAMLTVNSSALIRLPFVVDDPARVDRMTLRMRYDDGFAAFLNGVQVASANAPLTLDWNSAATAQHPDTSARAFESFDISSRAGLLSPGTNVLAIQGLNFSATNNDFLIQAEITGTTVGGFGTAARYFQTPTPGALNGTGTADLGPIFAGVNYAPTAPLDNQDIVVTARVAPATATVTNVTLRYRVMFGTTVVLPMFDDGAHGDGGNGDGIYGATIPASASAPSQMVRWYITAGDALGRSSRWPLFENPVDSPEYLGTVIVDTNIQSSLPVVFHYVENTAAGDTTGGTRCSMYHLGEFYDNIRMSLHGQSSAGFPKKSYDLDFNKDNRFRYQPGGPRVKDIKLLQNHGDKAKMRNSLGYEYMALAGSVAHFSFQVRVQRNGTFFNISDMIEDADDLWLERVGRDPNGALYKTYDNLASAGGSEKKTRRFEAGSADLTALINGLNPATPLATRALYAYDNIDLPQCISYCVASALISHQDHGHKNSYVYRDSDRTGEWMLFPWDIDLSWGRNWIDASGYFTDTIYLDNSLTFYNAAQQGKGANRFYDLIMLHPDFRRMYLRRLRTVMDKVLQPPGTPPGQLRIEARIRQLMDLMDPPAVGTSDADMDWNNWPKWGNNNPMRAEAQRIIDLYLPGRRNWLATNAAASLSGDRIPASQSATTLIYIGDVDPNPSSGNQAQEYVCITNVNPFAVDITDWKLAGAVRHTFRPGTVIPSNSVIYVSPHVPSFRARTTGPRGGQGLFVQGNYDGQLNARGESLQLLDETGRTVHTLTYPGNPSAVQEFLRVTEIMYHPSPLPAGASTNREDYEYIELKNISTNVTISLVGVRLTNGVDFSFTGSAVTSLGPQQTVLVVKNLAAFTSRYGGGLNVAGEYLDDYLDNAGEVLRLEDAVGEKVLEFDYNNAWYPTTDGHGFSLVIRNENAAWDTWGMKASWRPSGQAQGSPGATDPAPPAIPAIRVNEVLTHTSDPLKDSVELFNPTDEDVNIGGWFLTDDFINPFKFRIPAGTMIPRHGFAVFTETNFNPNPGVPPNFAFSAQGDEVFLFSGDANTNLTGYVHGYDFSAAENGVSFGPYVTSINDEHFVALRELTPGATNSYPKVGPVVIHEIMYRPPDLAGNADNSDDEYIELLNITGSDVPLFHAIYQTNTWHLRSAVDFDFPTGTSLAANGYLLVVGFDPAAATNTARLASFRARFSVPGGVPVLGPFSGKLDNSGETVKLSMPNTPVTNNVPYVLVDAVEFRDSAPWPTAADGLGPSLQRKVASDYGNDPANWAAARPTAGAARPAGTPPAVTTQPVGQTVIAFSTATFAVTATGAAPLCYQWRKDGANVTGATNETLVFTSVQSSNQGVYSVVVFNAIDSAESSNATLTVLIPASITQPPASQTMTNGGTVTFTVVASSTTPITYQWRHDGTNLPGATNTTLLLTNVQNGVDNGDYAVAVTDGVGTVLSATATLTVLVRPSIQQQPTPASQTVAVGGTATLTLSVSNNATLPMGFRWRRGGTAFVGPCLVNGTPFIVTSNNPILINSHTLVFTLTNMQTTNAGTWTCVPTNLAGTLLPFTGQVQAGLTLAGVITVVTPVAITLQPTNQTTNVGAIVNFNAAASGTAPIGYQWWFNGANRVAGATNASLSLTNVQLSNDGAYTLVATNAGSAATSQVAYLTILVPPSIVTQPTNQTTTLCSNVAFYVEATGGGPLRYQWWFNETNALIGATNNCLLITPPGLANAGNYHVVVSNVLNAVTSQVAVLTVTLGDSDGDGMPDEWEQANGFDPCDGSDRNEDADNDGQRNWQEQVAGTDPRDAGSYLKIDQITAGGSATIWFMARSNKTYTVEYNDHLPSVADWHKVGDVEAAATNRPAASVVDPAPSTSRAYRLVTPKQ